MKQQKSKQSVFHKPVKTIKKSSFRKGEVKIGNLREIIESSAKSIAKMQMETSLEKLNAFEEQFKNMMNISNFMMDLLELSREITKAMNDGMIRNPAVKLQGWPQIEGIRKIREYLSKCDEDDFPSTRRVNLQKKMNLVKEFFENSVSLTKNERLNAKRYADDMAKAWSCPITIYVIDSLTGKTNVHKSVDKVEDMINEVMSLLEKKKDFTVMMGGMMQEFTVANMQTGYCYVCADLHGTFPE